jgi:hypothetical protein
VIHKLVIPLFQIVFSLSPSMSCTNSQLLVRFDDAPDEVLNAASEAVSEPIRVPVAQANGRAPRWWKRDGRDRILGQLFR